MITSVSNPQMKRIKELLNKSKQRRKEKCFVAEGIRMVAETPADRLERVYVSESFYRHPPELRGLDLSKALIVDDQVFRQVSDTQTPQGIMAVVRQQESSLDVIMKQPDALLLFLENIQDPGNLGTMMRTAEGAGVTGIIMSRETTDIYNPKTIRSTMGSLYRVPFLYTGDLTQTIGQLQKTGIRVYAAHLKGTKSYREPDYTEGAAFLIGNEGNGLKEETAALADEYIRIPMQGKLESLNAAVAAALLMYEVAV